MSTDMEKLRELMDAADAPETPRGIDAAWEAWADAGGLFISACVDHVRQALAQLSPSSGEGGGEPSSDASASASPAADEKWCWSDAAIFASAGAVLNPYLRRHTISVLKDGLEAAHRLAVFAGQVRWTPYADGGPITQHYGEWAAPCMQLAHDIETVTRVLTSAAGQSLTGKSEDGSSQQISAPVSPALAEEVARIIDRTAMVEMEVNGRRLRVVRVSNSAELANAIIPVVLRAFQGVEVDTRPPVAQPLEPEDREWLVGEVTKMRRNVWSPHGQTDADAAYLNRIERILSALEGKAP